MNFSENIKDFGLLSELAYLKLEDEFFKEEKRGQAPFYM